MREKQIERKLVNEVKEQGGVAYKFVSPNKRGVPDRLVLMPIPPYIQKELAKYMYFVECKAPGKKPRADQIREHEKLRALGYRVLIY